MTRMATDPDNSEEELGERDLPDEADVKAGEDESDTFTCPYCGQEVYEDAIRCPHCQRYVSKEDAKSHHPWYWVVLIVILAMVGLAVWALTR